MKLRRIHLGFLLLFSLFSTPNVHAGGIYIETGVGADRIFGANTIFNRDDVRSPQIGTALNLTTAWNILHGSSYLQIHIGIQNHYVSGTHQDPERYLSVLATYPLIRLEMPRFYIGFGATPYVWTRDGETSAFRGLKKKENSFLFLGEAGLLWRIIPSFNLCLYSALQTGRYEGQTAAIPTLEAGIQFRFFITNSETNGRNRGKFDGWRYPFGLEL